MRGGFPAVLIVLGLLNGSGPAGGLPLRKGRAVDCVSWVRSRGWLVCLVIGVGNTPAAALLGGGGCPRVRWCVGVACCRGSGAVRPGCLARVLLPCVGGGVWVWVGWL